MRILQTLATAVVFACAPTLRAQQPISECADISHAIFTAQDLQALDKAAKLSTAQKESIESLMRDALSKARQQYGEYLRQCDERRESIYQAAAADVGNPEAYRAASKQYLCARVLLEATTGTKIAAIEREALGDIRSALRPEQASDGWTPFERFRRRLILEQRGWGGVGDQGRNPRSLVEGAKLSTEDIAAAEPVLARYDLDVDPLLTQRMDGLKRMNKDAQEKAHAGDLDYKVWRGMWSGPDLNTAAIKKLNVRTAIAVEKALSDEGRNQFLRQRVGLELSDEITRPAVDDRVRRVVKLKSLTPEQTDNVQDLIEQADKAVFQLALAELRARDDFALRGESPTEEQTRARDAETSKQYETRMSTLAKSLRALLNADQREEIDMVPFNREGGDPFKIARSPEEQSQWNMTPQKAEEQLKKLRGW